MNNRSEMNVCCNSCSRPSTDCPNTDPLRGMPLGLAMFLSKNGDRRIVLIKHYNAELFFHHWICRFAAASLKDFAVKKEVSHERK